MRSLFTPWRKRYLERVDEEMQTCIFCAAAQAADPRERWVLFRGRWNLIMLNLYPYSNGHMMIAPLTHWASPTEASPEALTEMALWIPVVLEVLHEAYRPHGFNLGMNLGRCAGAGFADHYHLHVLPRWEGDTNFMATVAETRLIPEDIPTTFDRLRPLLEARLRRGTYPTG